MGTSVSPWLAAVPGIKLAVPEGAFYVFPDVTGLVGGRGSHSFPLQLNLSSSVHRITQMNSCRCPGVAQVEL